MSLVDFITGLQLTPRQVQEVFRIIGHAMTGNKQPLKILWGYNAATILLSALSVGKPELYYAIGQERISIGDLGDALKQLFSHTKHLDWWINLVFTGHVTSENEDHSAMFFQEFQRLGLTKKQALDDQFKEELRQFYFGWGHDRFSRPISKVYTVIETVKSFDR